MKLRGRSGNPCQIAHACIVRCGLSHSLLFLLPAVHTIHRPVPRTSCWRNRSSIAVKPLSAKKRNQIASAHPPVWHSSVGFTINQSVSPGAVIAISSFIIITWLSFSHFQSVKSTTLLPPTIQKSSFRIRLRSDKPQFQGQP